MKKIVFIVFTLLISLQAYSQSTFKKGIVVGEGQVQIDSFVLSNGQIVPYTDGEISSWYNDSIADLNTRIVLLENADDVGPAIDSAVIYNAGPDTVYAYFDETVTGGTDSLLWSILYLDSYHDIYTPSVSGQTIKIPFDDTITVGVNATLSYVKPSSGGVVDIYGNQASTQSVSITNRVEGTQSATLIEDYRLEYNTTNDVTGFNAVKSSGMDYTTESIEGTYAGDMDGSNHFMKTISKDYSPQHSVSFVYKYFGESDYYRTLIEMGGLELKFNAANKNLELWSFNGSDSAMAYSDSLMTPGIWHHVVYTADSAAGEAHFWIDKVDADVDSLFRDDFDVQDQMTIGADDDNAFRSWGYYDFIQTYTGHLVQADVDELYNVIFRDESIDTTTLAPDSAYTTPTITQFVVQMNRSIKNTYADTSAYKFYIDDVQKPIRSITYNDKLITFVIDSLSGSEELVVRYTVTNHLWDEREVFADTFYTEIDNRWIASSNCLAHYRMENNANDASENSETATEGAGVTYSTTATEGTYSLGYGGTIYKYIESPVLELDGDSVFTISAKIYNNTGVGNDAFAGMIHTRTTGVTADRDGFEIFYDFVAGHPGIDVDNGSSTQTINGSATGKTTNEWIHLAVIIDRREAHDSVWIYTDTTLRASDAFTLDFPINEGIVIGKGYDQLYTGLVDDWQIYDGALTKASIVWLFENPGERIGGAYYDDSDREGDDDDEIIDPENFDILWQNTFNHWDNDYTLPIRYTGNSYNKTDTTMTHDWWYSDVGDDEIAHYFYTLGSNSTHYYYDSIIVDSETSSPVLKITNLYGERNMSDPSTAGGESKRIWWDTELDTPRELYFSYNVKFSSNFIFSGGGKLPGVLSKAPTRGSKPISNTEGFRASLLFYKGGIKSYHWVNYMDDPARYVNDDYQYGNDDRWGDFNPLGTDYEDNLLYSDGYFQFRLDRWYNITQRIVLNTDQNTDGLFEGYINGVLVEREDGYRWQYNGWDDYGIGGMYLQHFFGGVDPSLANCHIYIDDFVAFTYSDSYDNSKIKRDYAYNDTDVTLPLPYWPKADQIYNICGIGNSLSQNDWEHFDLLGDLYAYNMTNIAVAGDLINNQKADWDALSSSQKSSFDYVAILIGINDVISGRAEATIKTDFNALIAQIASDNSTAEIVVSTLTPARDNSGMSAAEYVIWGNINTWLQTLEGVTVDDVYTTNTSDLNDGSDNLDSAYDGLPDIPQDGLHVNKAGQILMYENLKAAIESL